MPEIIQACADLSVYICVGVALIVGLAVLLIRAAWQARENRLSFQKSRAKAVDDCELAWRQIVSYHNRSNHEKREIDWETVRNAFDSIKLAVNIYGINPSEFGCRGNIEYIHKTASGQTTAESAAPRVWPRANIPS